MPGTRGVGAVDQLADQMDGNIEGEDAVIVMITDMHQALADGARSRLDLKIPESEVGIVGPAVRHLGPGAGSGRGRREISEHGAGLRRPLGSTWVEAE
jgi:hypothetical protein